MNIANQVKSLTKDIEESFGTRIAAIADIVKETRQSLGNFNREHAKMAGDLKRSLASNQSGRASEVHNLRAENVELMKEVKSFIRGVEEEGEQRVDKVKSLLKSFAQEHQERTASLKRELSSFQRHLSSVVEDMRAANSSDNRQARTHWQNLARIMAAKRAGKSVPSPKAEMGVPTAVKEAAEEAFEGGELKERVLKVIQVNPSGIKLSQIGKVLGIAFVRTAKPIRELLAEVKVTKRDSKYLPT